MNKLISLIFAISSTVFAQGYETTCTQDLFGVHCNTQPDGLSQTMQWTRDLMRSVDQMPCAEWDARPHCMAIAEERNRRNMEEIHQQRLNEQRYELQRRDQDLRALELSQRQKLINQQSQTQKPQPSQPQPPYQYGIFQKIITIEGKQYCYFVPANKGMFYINGVPQIAAWYPTTAGKCGRRLIVASDGRGLMQ